jgi:predicted DsbA family dithiol-disulfide isomerase
MRVSSTLDELLKEYDGKVRVVFKNMVVHPDRVMITHKAGCAAAKQGKFVAFKNAFWEKGFKVGKFDEETLWGIAKDVGLDVEKLKADTKGPECQAVVDADMAELQKFRVNGTPGFFINGKFLGGAYPKEEFKKVIDERLKVAQDTGVAGADYYDKEIIGKGEKQFRSKMDPKPN